MDILKANNLNLSQKPKAPEPIMHVGGEDISEIIEGDSEELDETGLSLDHDYDIAKLKEEESEFYKPVKKLLEKYLEKVGNDFNTPEALI